MPLAWPVPVGLAASRVLAPRLRPGPVRHISAASSLRSSPVRASHISEVFHCRLIFLSTNPAVLPSPSPAGQVRPCVALAVLPAEGPLGPWPAPATPPDPASPRTQPGPEFVLLKLLKETVSSLGACARVPPSAVTAAPQPRGAPCLLSVNPLGL